MKIRLYAIGLDCCNHNARVERLSGSDRSQGAPSTSYADADVVESVDTAPPRCLELPRCQAIFIKCLVTDVALRSFTSLDEREMELDLNFLNKTMHQQLL